MKSRSSNRFKVYQWTQMPTAAGGKNTQSIKDIQQLLNASICYALPRSSQKQLFMYTGRTKNPRQTKIDRHCGTAGVILACLSPSLRAVWFCRMVQNRLTAILRQCFLCFTALQNRTQECLAVRGLQFHLQGQNRISITEVMSH